MSATAHAMLVCGVPYRDVVVESLAERKLVRYKPDTGKPFDVVYRQTVLTLCGVEIDDAPDPKAPYCWADRGNPERFWAKGTRPEYNLQRHLLEKWAIPKEISGKDDDPAEYLSLDGVIGLGLRGDWENALRGNESYSDRIHQPLTLELVIDLVNCMRDNLGRIGCKIPPKLYLTKWL